MRRNVQRAGQPSEDLDLHGHRPSDIVWNGTLAKIVQQCWEMGEGDLRLVHGHGRAAKTPGFVNTNTDVFAGDPSCLRHKRQLRQWIKYTTLDCREWGVTKVKLNAIPRPREGSWMPTCWLASASFRSCGAAATRCGASQPVQQYAMHTCPTQ